MSASAPSKYGAFAVAHASDSLSTCDQRFRSRAGSGSGGGGGARVVGADVVAGRGRVADAGAKGSYFSWPGSSAAPSSQFTRSGCGSRPRRSRRSGARLLQVARLAGLDSRCVERRRWGVELTMKLTEPAPELAPPPTLLSKSCGS